MSEVKYLVPMADGGICDVKTDADYYAGCETCDYGSRYINNVAIRMATGIININTERMYEYAMSEGYMMKLLISNIDAIRGMKEQEFFNWLKDQLDAEYGKVLRMCVFIKG